MTSVFWHRGKDIFSPVVFYLQRINRSSHGLREFFDGGSRKGFPRIREPWGVPEVDDSDF